MLLYLVQPTSRARVLLQHEHAPAMHAPHQALVLQDLDRLLHCRLRQAFFLREPVDRRQRVPGPEVTGLDPLPQGSSQPQVGRIA